MSTTKVISFCLFGDNPKYTHGAVRNAELAADIYPDWKLLFFCGLSVPRDILIHIGKANVNAACVNNNTDGDWSMMLDRLIPSLNPDKIDVFISRDCDSRLSLREKSAVDQWLESDKTFHFMHDHPYHTVPILGGMFGVKRAGFDGLYESAVEWQKTTKAEWQQDQNFLKEVVWPLARRDFINHDDGFFPYWNNTPFPTKRNGLEFVGEIYDENDTPNSEHRQVLANYINQL